MSKSIQKTILEQMQHKGKSNYIQDS